MPKYGCVVINHYRHQGIAKLKIDKLDEKNGSWPVSRVLSWTTIRLGCMSPYTSSDLPESSAGHANGLLFGLAPDGVYHATSCYQLCGALLPHPFTLTWSCPKTGHRRSALCCTFRRLAPPRGYLAPCPMEPGLSSPSHPISPVEISRKRSGGCLANSRRKVTTKQSVRRQQRTSNRRIPRAWLYFWP